MKRTENKEHTNRSNKESKRKDKEWKVIKRERKEERW